MEAHPDLAMALLRAGLLMGIVVIGQTVVVRHLPVESIPGVLRGRVELFSRLRPWLVVAAAGMAALGLVLELL